MWSPGVTDDVLYTMLGIAELLASESLQGFDNLRDSCGGASGTDYIGVRCVQGKSRMKIRSLAVFLMLFTLVAVAQESLSEPEFADVFFRLDNGKLIQLERQTAAIQGHASGFIVMSMKTSSEFPGAKSPVRFPSAQPLDFVVRSPFAASTVDPNTFYVLRRLNGKRKSRELVIMVGHASPVGASTKSNLAEGVLPLAFARYGTSSIRMTTGPLPPGEYAVSRLYAQTVFCFGVD